LTYCVIKNTLKVNMLQGMSNKQRATNNGQ